MDANQLTGTIPPQLYNFSNLIVFGVQDNQLQGSIPWDIGNTLPNLQWLAISYNELSGPIPISLLNCSKLTTLLVTRNQLTGPIPEDLGRLQQLFRISAGYNRLGSRGGNDLEFLSSLTNCTNLEVLSVGGNVLRGSIPKSTGNLSATLKGFDIEENQIYGEIPSEIGNLIGLENFGVADNLITGNLPNDLGRLGQLQVLRLHRNRLTGRIPSSLGNLTLLNILLLGFNDIDGAIPSNLAQCQNLLYLDMSYSNLNGTIPGQLFDNLSRLTTLGLDHNAFTGHLPFQVGNLNNLVSLDVSGNKLSETIPETLGKCDSLVQLNMQNNLFEGAIPKSLNALRGIEVLDVSNNKLTGEIPQFLGNLPFLKNLNLSFNDLEGTVPEEGVFRNASGIRLYGNDKLCGGMPELKLPSCLGLSTKKNRESPSLVIKAIVPTVVGTVSLAALAYFFVMSHKRRLSRKNHSSLSSVDNQLLRVSYGELLKATNNFSDDNLNGVGAFGYVYKGILGHEETTVAVKVLNLKERGVSKSFISECNALKNVRHRNLVKILTSCSRVDFHGMPNGSLDKWLYPEQAEEKESRNLSLLQRLNVAIDVASALEYLHHQCGSTIVHSDLKPSNILLDGDMTARVGDLGISKVLSLASDILERVGLVPLQ